MDYDCPEPCPNEDCSGTLDEGGLCPVCEPIRECPECWDWHSAKLPCECQTQDRSGDPRCDTCGRFLDGQGVCRTCFPFWECVDCGALYPAGNECECRKDKLEGFCLRCGLPADTECSCSEAEVKDDNPEGLLVKVVYNTGRGWEVDILENGIEGTLLFDCNENGEPTRASPWLEGPLAHCGFSREHQRRLCEAGTEAILDTL
jgi:hypothetical protein